MKLRMWHLNNKWGRVSPEQFPTIGHTVAYYDGVACLSVHGKPYDIRRIKPCDLAHYMVHVKNMDKKDRDFVTKNRH
jgi:hypothetical protein